MSNPRIPPLPESEWSDEIRPMLEPMGPLNVFTTLARHPKLFKRWMVFGAHVLAKSTLPARERELAILRVGWRCDSAYEFGQHTIIGGREGIVEEEIRRLATESLDGWSDEDAAIVRAADELVAFRKITDATWAELVGRWSTEQVLDLIFTVGQYTMLSMALNSLEVQIDDGFPGFPQ